MVQTQVKWSELKTFITTTKLYNFMNYLRLDTDDYYVWVTYEGMTFYTMLMHGTDDNKDFIDNFKSKAILKNDISIDGKREVRSHRVAKGRYLQDLFVQVRSSTKELRDKTGAFSVKLYDVNGAITDNPEVAEKTVIRFAPKYTYELYAGGVSSLETVTEDIWIDTVIAPDIPRPIGGSVVNIVNRQLLKPAEDYNITGTGPVELVYDPTSPVKINVIDIKLSHRAGYKLKIQLELQVYA